MAEELPLIRILVLDRGYVLACRCLDPENYAIWIPVTDSRTIRVWGTREGLGELCDGPVDTSTKLDRMIAHERIPVRAIIRVIEVDQKKWQKHMTPKRKTHAAPATA